MSRGRCPSVMPPRLFTPRTWLPATPAMTRSTGTPATPSASSIARRTEVAAALMFAINPFRRPLDSAAPMATNLAPVSFNSPMMAHVFVLPTSSATRFFSFFVNPPLLLHSACPGCGRAQAKDFKFQLAPLPRDFHALWHALGHDLGRALLHIRRDGLRFRIHHHLPRKPQIHRIDAPGAGSPLIDIFR